MGIYYCVYLTIYKGGKMPPFYIGSSSTQRLRSGYIGSPASKSYKKIFKQEKIENRHLFKTRIISTHHSREDAYIKEKLLHEKLQVHLNPMYINQHIAYSNHYTPRTTPFTDSHKRNMSAAAKLRLQKYGPNRGRLGKTIDETQRIKHSMAQLKRFADQTQRQILSEIRKQKLASGEIIHNRKGRTLSDETKAKIRNSLLRRRQNTKNE